MYKIPSSSGYDGNPSTFHLRTSRLHDFRPLDRPAYADRQKILLNLRDDILLDRLIRVLVGSKYFLTVARSDWEALSHLTKSPDLRLMLTDHVPEVEKDGKIYAFPRERLNPACAWVYLMPLPDLLSRGKRDVYLPVPFSTIMLHRTLAAAIESAKEADTT